MLCCLLVSACADSSHGLDSRAEAIKAARSDSLSAVAGTPISFRCTPRGNQLGQVARGTRLPSGTFFPTWEISVQDLKQLPPVKTKHDGKEGRAILLVMALPSAQKAALCARGGIWQELHLGQYDAQFNSHPMPKVPAKRFSSITVDTYPHSPNAPGHLPGTTGAFETYLAQGRVLAMGESYNAHDARIVEADLKRLASQVS
jgi:hypothetical protein